jgi:hypothetical protein
LDLKEAEAQAKEAQIEAALERVRSRSMGMQKSVELRDVIQVIFEQLVQLNFKIDNAGFLMDYRESDDYNIWMMDAFAEYPTQQHIPYFDHVVNRDYLSHRDDGQEQLFTKVYSKEEKNTWLGDVWKYLPEAPKEILEALLDSPGLAISRIFMKNIGLYILDYSATPFSEIQNDTLIRFAKVFEQTYTRFNDLKQAEAQAKEAKIEAALERVRARSLAMHHTSELQSVVDAVSQQFKNLDIDANGGVFITINKEVEKDLPIWGSSGAANYVQKVTVPYLDKPIFIQLRDAIKNRNDFFIEEYTHKEKIEFFQHLFNHSPWNSLPPKRKKELLSREGGYTRSLTVSRYTSIFIINHNGKKFSESDNDILKRFGKVFEQSYTRFLDLQKAEAQAREAQIEAALERVRGKTMAMHKSDELADTASVVFQQLIHLGIEPNRIYIAIIKDEKANVEFWITDEDGSKVSSGFTANLMGNRSFLKMYEGWKAQIKSITIDMRGEELQEYFAHLKKLNVPFKGGLSQKRRIQHIAYFSKGFIGVASPDETRHETIPLLERFAAVFNLTYTRFNDLLQAEAQNKIIQAENERKSKELEEARELQLAMLPKQIPEHPELDIKVYMQTATEVGGDYYDFSYRDDGSINIAIGDATGHGMKAGTLVTMMKSFFIANSSSKDIDDFFTSSNAAIKNSNLKRMMAGFAMLNIKDHTARFINAAMPPLYHYRKKEEKIVEIKHHSLPLGAMAIEKYKSIEFNLNKGDVLIMMSDGFPELRCLSDELFGYERVYSSIEKVAEKSPDEIISHFKSEAGSWSDKKEPDDDITFVVIKIK